MKAMVLARTADVGTSPLQLRELPIPEPGPGELLVRLTVCGICRTDLHVVEGELADPALPLIPGHQAVGLVSQVGTGVSERTVGERVGIAWLQHTCGVCEFCTSGRENLCERARFTGYQVDGGYAEYALVPAAFAYPIPPVFSDEEAAPSPLCWDHRLPRVTFEWNPARPTARSLWVWCVGSHSHPDRSSLGLSDLCQLVETGASAPRP